MNASLRENQSIWQEKVVKLETNLQKLEEKHGMVTFLFFCFLLVYIDINLSYKLHFLLNYTKFCLNYDDYCHKFVITNNKRI